MGQEKEKAEMTPRSYRHDMIDMQADEAHAEGKRLAQEAITGINNKVGFWIRSEGQIRRYERAKKKEAAK